MYSAVVIPNQPTNKSINLLKCGSPKAGLHGGKRSWEQMSDHGASQRTDRQTDRHVAIKSLSGGANLPSLSVAIRLQLAAISVVAQITSCRRIIPTESQHHSATLQSTVDSNEHFLDDPQTSSSCKNSAENVNSFQAELRFFLSFCSGRPRRWSHSRPWNESPDKLAGSCGCTANESVPKIITNNTRNLFL